MSNYCYQALISATELQELTDRGAPLLLIDVSFDLADPSAGQAAYVSAHLPGAHYLHLDRDLSGSKAEQGEQFRGRHPLPQRADFAHRMAALGLCADLQVVAYDAQGGMYAARLWWMLRWIGHSQVAVLDGGLQAWTGAGRPTSQALPQPQPSDYALKASLVDSWESAQLLARLGQVRLIDARAPERFRGEIEPLDSRAGHIPGASNRPFKNNLQTNACFKPVAELAAEFTALLAPYAATQVVHQCGSGVTACHNLLAMEHAGLSGSILYPGSWSEWSADPLKPIAKV